MLPKNLEELTRADIEGLVANSVREGKTLDFKRGGVGNRDEDKREFLADITAFANTIGGDLIFGVDEAQGVATETAGIQIADSDEEIRRLDQVIRSGLDPRLPGIEFKWIAISPDRGFLVIRVARSWAAPHRVVFRDSKFYARSSAGKYPMDVAELRSAFLASEEVPERIRRFRRDRCTAIEVGDGAMPTASGPQLVVHLLPISAFTASSPLARVRAERFGPMGVSGFNMSHCLEGEVTHTSNGDRSGAVGAYTLTFRDGRIEAVASIQPDDSNKQIHLGWIESLVLGRISEFYGELRNLGLEPPFVFMASLTGVRGFSAHQGNRWSMRPSLPIRRDALFLPDILISEDPTTWALTLKPTFDLLWNAFGVQGSPHYDAAGNYAG